MWLSKYLKKSTELLALRNLIPQNAYFLKKALSFGIKLHMYVVCPKCHELYNPDDCIIKLSDGTTESLKCAFVEYPNHPHISRRGKCGALLMKKVKYGSKYQLIPRKVYALKRSLVKLFSREGFASKLEMWRKRQKSAGMYTDIYDGSVWEEFQTVNGSPFLDSPNNLAFVLNIEWFKPLNTV